MAMRNWDFLNDRGLMVECDEARERNRKRYARANRKIRTIELKASEILALDIQPTHITIRRPVWGEFARKAWCPYATEGERLILTEPVKYFGRDPEYAAYLYSTDKAYASSPWPEIAASRMPVKARRFHMLAKRVQRLVDSWLWEIELVAV